MASHWLLAGVPLVLRGPGAALNAVATAFPTTRIEPPGITGSEQLAVDHQELALA